MLISLPGRYADISTGEICWYIYRGDMLISLPGRYARISTGEICWYIYRGDMLISLPGRYARISIGEICSYLYRGDMLVSLPGRYADISTGEICWYLYWGDMIHVNSVPLAVVLCRYKLWYSVLSTPSNHTRINAENMALDELKCLSDTPIIYYLSFNKYILWPHYTNWMWPIRLPSEDS